MLWRLSVMILFVVPLMDWYVSATQGRRMMGYVTVQVAWFFFGMVVLGHILLSLGKLGAGRHGKLLLIQTVVFLTWASWPVYCWI